MVDALWKPNLVAKKREDWVGRDYKRIRKGG